MGVETDFCPPRCLLEGPCVLVVDDEPSIRRLLGVLLHTFGYRAELAADGMEARAVVERETVSLILCDAHLRGESGLALMRGLLRQCPQMVGLMMSGDGDDSPWAAGMCEGGIYGRIAKPFDAQEVADRIAQALCGRRVPEAPAHRRDTPWCPPEASGEGVIGNHTPDSATGSGTKGLT